MNLSDRHLILIIIICLGTVSVAAAIKISQFTNIAVTMPGVFGGPMETKKDVDAKFYETQESPPAKTPVAVKPVDPISAAAYIVGDVVTGKIYVSKNSSTPLPVASMSKLVTAFVATDELSATNLIEVTEAETRVPADGSQLRAGEKFLRDELLLPLLLNSSNVAAEVLASSSDREHYIDLMRSYAWEVGMPSTFFADPSGLTPQNAASGKDLFALAQYLYTYRPDILAITRIPHASTATTTEHGAHEFTNIHPFVTNPNFIGGKTGRTPEAGDTMMTIIRIQNHPIAIVVLGSRYNGRAGDTQLLIDRVDALLSKPE